MSSGLRSSICLSFYLFISNPAPLPLPPSSLHSFVLLFCLPCCHSVCFSLIFLLLPLFWLIYRFSQLSHLPLLSFRASLHHLAILPLCLSVSRVNVALFSLDLKSMVFLRKSVADFYRARGPECHRSRLIYPPPLSSCYAWSLNFPFLLFFRVSVPKFLL